ncbi:hypothetical protein GQ600_16975 [Phytophthora cactorum]|nr:hypothetical protein GQ600_16975 [Phytophthora cactorum]
MLSRVDGACQFGHEGCDNGVFRVEVSKSVTVHNHKIGPSVYCQYAKSRKIVRCAPSILPCLRRSRIVMKVVLRKHLPKDVHNIVQRFKLEDGQGALET